MRKRLRLSLPLALALALTLAAPDAQAQHIKKTTEALGVTLGLGDLIVSGQVAVWQHFHRKADQFILYLDVTENRITGEDIFLAAQRAVLSDYILVSPDGGPNGRALYDAVWSTPLGGLHSDSTVTVCAQLFRLNGRAASSLECRNFDPFF